MSSDRQTVAFIIPLYNEEDVVPHLLDRVEHYRANHSEVTQVVLVDDGSTDHTARLVRDLTSGKEGYVLLQFSRNFGHQLAITAGMHFVTTDAAIIMDADLQDPLFVATRMIEKWREGYDVVYGIRKKRQGETIFKRGATHLFYRVFRHLADIDAPLDTGDFRLVSRAVLDSYERIQEHGPYVRGLISWLGFNQTGIEYVRPGRKAGGTKYPLRKLVRLAVNGITSFSDRPLRYAARLGVLVAALSLLGLGWVVINKLFFGISPTGWASLMVTFLFFSGVQLLFLGVMGSYLARVLEEVRNRPRYVISGRWHSDQAVTEPDASTLSDA